MSRVPTSVVVVGDTTVGMVVGTFTSISLAPLLVGYLGELLAATLSARNLAGLGVHGSAWLGGYGFNGVLGAKGRPR